MKRITLDFYSGICTKRKVFLAEKNFVVPFVTNKGHKEHKVGATEQRVRLPNH